MMRPRIDRMNGLDDIAPAEWNALAGAQHPFTSWQYLHALEASGSANSATGWEPAHRVARDSSGPCAALPLYRKSHSYGEFVFDFAWADACHRVGLAYYPKLLTAIPFTPVTGPRLLGRDADALIPAVIEQMREEGMLSWHVLFPAADECDTWQQHGFLQRLGTRFAWRDRGFGDFEGFLASLKQKRRKEIRRERRQVEEAGVRFRTLTAAALDTESMDRVYACYARTYYLRGQDPYLSRDFFHRLAEAMNDAVVVFCGFRNEEMIAAAICLRDEKTLYGRWWGTLNDLPGLHFEACYYQGIAFCLEHGLTRYDPGVQGEHKLARGFAPEITTSMHRFNHPGLEAAVREALQHEAPMIRAYARECEQRLPFKSDT